MRTTIFLGLSLLYFLLPLSGQETALKPDSSDTGKQRLSFVHEIGLVAAPLERLTSQTNTIGYPYLLTYKFSANRLALRAGIGGSYQEDIFELPDFSDNERRFNTQLDARLGIEYQKEITERWRVAFGGDAVFSRDVSTQIEDSGVDVVTTQSLTLQWGAGPVAGVWFNLNAHLSIYTEGAAYLLLGSQDRTRQFENFPEFDDELSSRSTRDLRFHIPGTLFLIYRF